MMKKSLILSVLLIASLLVSFSPVGLPVVHAKEALKVIKAIDVKGNKSVSSLTILAKVQTQIGQPSSSAVLNEDLKRLYGMGFFSDVRIEQEDFEDGLRVIFNVTEKPVLSEIRIEGERKIKKDQIKKEMQSVIGDFVDQKRVRDDVQAVAYHR